MKYTHEDGTPFTKEEFLQKLKTDKEFNDEFGSKGIDQIANLINDLKTNPDSRRLLVSAWNPSELDQMVLPPCHYGFQVYTRELSWEERSELLDTTNGPWDSIAAIGTEMDRQNLPTRAISLMWNQRSVDTFLGLPFNIASYGLLLEIIAKSVNMIPDELIGNLGDTHLYLNHIEQAKEQIGRKYTADERTEMLKEAMGYEAYHKAVEDLMPFGGGLSEYYNFHKIPHHTREPYPLPTLAINNQVLFGKGIDEMLNSCLIEGDFVVEGYQSHPTIKAPLSN
jgi:thymidylate synthase